MVENILKKIKSKEEYDNDIKETKNNLVTINESIEFWSKKKPFKIFKKKNREYEERVEKLYGVKRYLEERLDRLNEEKKRLYP